MDTNNVNYDWQFDQMDVYTNLYGKSQVIYNIHWKCTATTGSYSASKTGKVSVEYDPNDSWVEFQDITKEQVQIWVEDRMTRFSQYAIIQLKENLAQEIEDQINPPSLTVKSPWL